MKPKKRKPKKVFALEWAFEPFSEHPGFFTRKMFGCLGAYLDDRIVMFLAENSDSTDWNGVLLPTEREFQESMIKDYPSLRPHKILPKWLYLPMTAMTFEDDLQEISQRISDGDLRFGAVPEKKKAKKKKKRKKSKAKSRKKTKRKKVGTTKVSRKK